MPSPAPQPRRGGSGQGASRGRAGRQSRSPAPCSLSSALAERAGSSAAARTIVIILINPLPAEYCGLLAGPSRTISISPRAGRGGSQIAHAGSCFAEQTETNMALPVPSAKSGFPPGRAQHGVHQRGWRERLPPGSPEPSPLPQRWPGRSSLTSPKCTHTP